MNISNLNSTQGLSGPSAGKSSASVSDALATFRAAMAGLGERPLKVLAVQPFAGTCSARSLAMQKHADTSSAN